MKNIIKKLCILFMSIVFIFNISECIYAAPKSNTVEETSSIKTYNFNSDVVFNGAFSSYSTYFDIDEWWKNTKVDTEISFSINQLIKEDQNAYIKLSINNVPFYSEKIFNKDDCENQDIKVTIPSDLVKAGSNELKIEAYLRLTEKPCIDDVNISNWLVIKKDSNIKVTFNNIISSNKISEFPYPFLKNIDSTNESKDDLSIVIPDEHNDSELSCAYMLNSYLGKLNSRYENSIRILKYSDYVNNKGSNVIYIGNYNNIPSEFNVETKSKNDCLIKIMDSTDINNKKMVILSDDEDNLIKGIKFLQNKDLVFQIDSDTFYVGKNLQEETKYEDKSGKITFKDIGINEIQLTGAFRRQSTVSYSIAKNKIFSGSDKIKLFMRYSENLDFDKSLVTIYINNTPIGSKKLEKENCQQDEIELSFPSDVTSTSYIEIKIAFDLELSNTYCEKRQEEMPWALVTGDSYLYLGNNEVNEYYFSNYSNPFVKNNMFNDVAMIVPDNLSSSEINSLGKVVGYLGKDVLYNNGDFKVVRNSNMSESDKKKNLIIYGTPDKNALISEVNDNLWFKYDEKYSKFLSNEKLELTEPFSSRISNFQFDISKYDNQKAMLVLTSPDEEILRNSLVFLSEDNKFVKLNGDCAIINEYGDIKTYKMKKETETPVYEQFQDLDGSEKGLILMLGLFLIFVIVAGVLYFLKNNSKKEKNKK